MKATDYCNLGCKYCYVPQDQRNISQSLSLDTLPILFRKMFDWQQNEESRGDIEMCWSGGEVLTLPLNWWEEMFATQKTVYESGNYTFKIKNSIQTNLTLLDEHRFEFLNKHKVGIGTSIDGPKEIMDRTRIFKDGRSAFDVIINRINRLKEKYNFTPGAIVVLSKANATDIDKIFHFFNEIKVGFQINTYHYAPSSSDKHTLHELTTDEYLNTMCHLFDLWSERSDSVEISNFKRIMDFLLYGKRAVCKMDPACAVRFYMVRWNGDVYPCNEFSGADFEKKYCYGNLIKQDWHEIRDHPTRKILLERDKAIQEFKHKSNKCLNCRYWKACHGGCFHCTLKYQYCNNEDIQPMTVASHRDVENCEKTYGLYKYIEDKLRIYSKKHLLPVLLYPDRVTNNKEERRQSFYNYQEQTFRLSSIDPKMQADQLQPVHYRLLGMCLKDYRKILYICCDSEESIKKHIQNNETKTYFQTIDYRNNGFMNTQFNGGDNITKWNVWSSGKRWDVIVIPIQYIHPDDVLKLLYLCENNLELGGKVIVCSTSHFLHKQKFLDVSEYYGIKEYDPKATAINCRDMSYAILS